jgi:hypothetical protein
MAALSRFHFIESGAPSRCAPLTSTRRVNRRTDLAEIAARAAIAVGKAVLVLWTALALGFWLLVIVASFL